MDKEIYEIIKGALQDIIDGNLENVDQYLGICGNLKRRLKYRKPIGIKAYKYSYDFVGELSHDWKYFSGNSAYPIPSTHKDINEEDSFNNYPLDMWKGKQLKLRQSLAKHLLAKLEGECYDSRL